MLTVIRSVIRMEESNPVISEEAKRWKNFMAAYKKHRFISPFGIISSNEGGQTLPLRYVIHSLKGLSMQEAKDSTVNSMVYAFLSATFFSKKKAKFFGRTYQSEPIQLSESKSTQRTFETSQPHVFYCHSQIDDNADSMIVMELELKEINLKDNTVIHQKMIGWTSIDSVFGIKPDKAYPFFKGTARTAIASRDSESRGATAGNMQFEIARSENVLEVANLFPSSVIVGHDEVVPGIHHEHLPNTPNSSGISIVETRDIYIEQVVVTLSPDVLRSVKEDCRQFRLRKYDEMKSKVPDVYVQEVRLYSYFHNGWTAVNREGFGNYTVLRRINDDHYEFNGTFSVADTFTHDLACLIVQLEATIKIPLENSIEESMRVVLGWKPIFIEQQMFNTRSDISKDLIIGTGYTLNFDKLFHLPGRTNETSANLRLALNLTSSMTRALGSSQLPRSMPAGNDMVMNRLNNRLRESNAEAEKLRKANEKLEQVLRSNIERERHDRSMSPVPTSQIMHQQPVVQSLHVSHTPNDFERQYLGKMDKLLDTITEMQRNQSRQPPAHYNQPPPQYNQSLYQQPNNLMFQQPPGKFGRQPMATVPGSQRYNYDNQANQTRSMLMNDQQSGGINRVDRAGYIDAGIKGLIDPFGMNDPALQNLNLKVEFDDPKKICTITLQFLGIKYLVPGNDLKQFNFRIPDRVYFTFDFFTCPVFRTKNLTYMNTNLDELHQQPSSFLDRQMILINEDFSKGSGTMKEPIVQFEVNPMKEGTTSVYDSLVEYLAKKELMIDVWDGDSLMHFGRANYKLHNLLRQGKDTEMCSPTLEIFDQQTKVMRGTIQMSLKNQAIMLDSRSEACPPEKVHFHFNRAQRSGKYKVKSFKPLDIKKEISQGFDQSRAVSDAELNDEEYRKKLRIDRFKIMRSQMPAGPATDSRITPDIQSFNQSLREVEAIRERKKPEVISNAMTKGYSDEHQISGIFGHPKYVTYKFENVTKQIMDYKVKIEHSKNCIPEEFTLVRSPREWEFMCNELRVERPSEWGMLEHMETFSLMGGDSITLIFKFLSFDEETLKQGKGVDKVASINITDYSGQVICGISFTFHLRHPIIDRTLTFYEMENRISSLELPPFYTSINTTYPQPIVLFSNPTAVLEWVTTNEAKVKVKVPPSPNVMTFYMFVYEDENRIRLLGLYRIVINSQLGYFNLTQNRYKLYYGRMAKIFSDNPKMIAFDEQYQNQFELFPGTHNFVTYKLRSFKPSVEKIRVNCVDNYSKELVQGWTFMVNTTSVAPDEIHTIHVTQHKSELLPPMSFVNKLNMPVTYEVESADPQMIQVVQKHVQVEANAKSFIQLRALGQNQPGTKEAYIYIVESNGSVSLCWKLLVVISPNN